MALTGTLAKLNVIFTGDVSGFKAALQDVNKQLDGVSGKFAATGQKLSGIGKKLSTGITLPVVALGAASVRAFADFDQAMTNSTAIMGTLSDEIRSKMELTAREVAKSTTFSATQAAEAYFYLASAGLDAAQSIEALPKVAAFAQAGNFDMALATDLLTDAQSALGLTIRDDVVKNMENMVRVSDVLVKANVLSNATVQQFSESLTNKAGAAMRLLNMDVEEGVAILAAWADQGIKGSEAGEKLNILLRDLQSANIKNRDAWENLNIAVFDSSGKMRNVADIVEDLTKVLGSMSDEQKRVTLMQLGFQDRSVSATMSLLGMSDAIRHYEKELRGAGNTTQDVAQKQLQSMSNQWALAKSRMDDIAITIGGTLAPHLIALTKHIEGLLNWFTNLSPETQQFIVTIAGIAAVIGPVILIIGKLITALQVLIPVIKGVGLALKLLVGPTNPVGLVLTAIGLLVAAGIWLYENWDTVKEFLSKIWKTISDAFMVAINFIVDITKSQFELMRSIITAVWNGIKQFFGTIWNGIKTVFTAALDFAVNYVKFQFNLMKTVIEAVWNGIKWFFETIWNGIKAVFNTTVNAVRFIIEKQFNLIKTVIQTIWNGIKGFFTNVLGGIWDAVKNTFIGIYETIFKWLNAAANFVKDKLAAVGKFFKNLYTAVVGRSYIPDMVLESIKWMDTMGKEMTAKTKEMTEEIRNSWKDLRDFIISTVRDSEITRMMTRARVILGIAPQGETELDRINDRLNAAQRSVDALTKRLLEVARIENGTLVARTGKENEYRALIEAITQETKNLHSAQVQVAEETARIKTETQKWKDVAVLVMSIMVKAMFGWRPVWVQEQIQENTKSLEQLQNTLDSTSDKLLHSWVEAQVRAIPPATELQRTIDILTDQLIDLEIQLAKVEGHDHLTEAQQKLRAAIEETNAKIAEQREALRMQQQIQENAKSLEQLQNTLDSTSDKLLHSWVEAQVRAIPPATELQRTIDILTDQLIDLEIQLAKVEGHDHLTEAQQKLRAAIEETNAKIAEQQAAFNKLSKGMKNEWLEAMKALVQSFVQSTQKNLETFFQNVMEKGLNSWKDLWRSVLETIKQMIASFLASAIVRSLINMFPQFFSTGSSAPQFAGSYASGGMIPGPIGAPRMALVHGGEAVLTPEQQRAFGRDNGDIHITIENKSGTPVQGRVVRTQMKRGMKEVLLELVATDGDIRNMIRSGR